MVGKDSDAIGRIEDMLNEVLEMTTHNYQANTAVVKLLEDKVDRLIDVASGKDRIPLNVFGWVVGTLLVLLIVREVGVSGIKEILNSLGDYTDAAHSESLPDVTPETGR